MVSYTVISCIYKDELDYNVKKNTIESLIASEMNIVIFTNKETWDEYLNFIVLTSHKPNLQIYCKEYHQFFGWYTKIDWDIQRLLDKKEQVMNQFSDYKESIRNYILRNEKLEFIYEVSQKDTFNSDYYIWTDTLFDFNQFTNVTNNSNKILLLTHSEFDESEFELYKINNIPKIDYNATQFSRINDKLMIINKDLLKKFHDEYYHLLFKFPKYKRFVGNSCFNMNYIYILNKNMFELIKMSEIS